MRILLLEDAPHLPSYGGGNKANRLLLEGLAALGHDCALVARAVNDTLAPATLAELASELAVRGITWQASADGHVISYGYRGVEVTALHYPQVADRRAFVRGRIDAVAPDWLLVSDDRRGFLLDAALEACPERTVALVHTAFHLPFGPQAGRADGAATERLRAARAVLTVSRFAANYLREHGDIAARVVRFPVFGRRAELPPGARRGDAVGMVNPCAIKGMAIFLGLARRFPQTSFVAVPTWGADEGVLAALRAVPNVRLLAAADDLEAFLYEVRALVVPSLIAETFGYVAVEAMAAGIPVLASDLGGLPEAKLGVPYLLPVVPAEWRPGDVVVPPQPLGPWADTLADLFSRPCLEADLSAASRRAAGAFIDGATADGFAAVLRDLAA